jgi:uncharacterized protein (TIGR04255 family)
VVTQLKNAPVVYVLGVLRFPELIDPRPFAAALQTRLSDVYPRQEEFTAPHFQVNLDQDGVNFTRDEVRTWQLASQDGSWALMVNAGHIAFHTNRYTDHADFVERFADCVQAAGVKFVHGIGLRYVDLIVPKAGERLEDYLAEGFLPTDIKEAGLSVQEGVYAAGYATRVGALRVQTFRRPPTVLPLELNSEATQRGEWAPKRPEGDFAVLDVDHGAVFDSPIDMDKFDVRKQMLELHGPIRSVFDALVTSHALKIWNGES